MTTVFANDRYIIATPSGIDEILFDARFLGHMAHTFVYGDNEIAFLRREDTPGTPLLTLLVRDGRVIEARGVANRVATREEQAAIDLWNPGG
jgi:hypothetical protein